VSKCGIPVSPLAASSGATTTIPSARARRAGPVRIPRINPTLVSLVSRKFCGMACAWGPWLPLSPPVDV